MAVNNLYFPTDQLFFAKKISVLMRATSDDDTPIPGYLYQEISNISLESPAHCEFLLQFLIKRMARLSCHIKYKTLKLMKYIVENGNPDFKAGLQRAHVCVQEATKYGGPPDPVHGNVPYQTVRQTAKALCQILFSDQLQREQSTEIQKHMSGMGSQSISSGVKYEGFGNSPLTKKSLKNTLQDKLEDLADTFASSPSKRQAEIMAQMKEIQTDYEPPILPFIPQSIQPEEKYIPKVVPVHIPGRAGGGWDNDNEGLHGSGSGTQSEWSGDISDREVIAETGDWSDEEELVKKYLFLEDRNQFFLLKPSQLTEFRKHCHLVNCEKIIDVINKLLHSTDDYIIARSMLLLETFLVHCDLISLDYIVTTCGQRLFNLYSCSTDVRLKFKAGKIVSGIEWFSNCRNIPKNAEDQT